MDDIDYPIPVVDLGWLQYKMPRWVHVRDLEKTHFESHLKNYLEY